MKKEDINYVFEQNPNLAEIGTKTQYYNYLQTIFPESKVKNIVYHGAPSEFDEFSKEVPPVFRQEEELDGFYFTDNLNIAKEYVTSEKGKINAVLLNLRNPVSENYNSQNVGVKNLNKKLRFNWLLKKDGAMLINCSDLGGIQNQYVAFEPSQIHILGSKKDIQGFKDFVINDPQNSLENKVVSGLFGIITLAGLYFGISGISGTGAAIGITNSSSGFLGVLLFVSGIAGLFFSRK